MFIQIFCGLECDHSFFYQKIFLSQMDLMDHFWMSTFSLLSALRMTKGKKEQVKWKFIL